MTLRVCLHISVDCSIHVISRVSVEESRHCETSMISVDFVSNRDGDFEELINRNRTIASSAITKAISAATSGLEFHKLFFV